MDEAVEDRIGIGRVANDRVPILHGELAGDDGRAAAIAFFQDFQQIVPGLGIERFQSPIIQNQQLDATERAGDAGIAAVAARERQVAEQLGDALIEDGAIVAASLVAEGAREPTFADAGRAADGQIVVGVDLVAGDELLEQQAIEAARGAVIDILDQRLLAQPGIAQPGGEFPVVPIGHLPIEQKRQPFRMGERRRLGRGLGFAEGLRHAEGDHPSAGVMPADAPGAARSESEGWGDRARRRREPLYP